MRKAGVSAAAVYQRRVFVETMRGPTVIPCLRYRNARGMIDWSCETFGFEKHASCSWCCGLRL